jgi:hypothetical protein
MSLIRQRFQLEKQLFINHYKEILYCLFGMIYLASTLGRNLAYYRAIQGPRLPDIGFEILPELPEHWKIVSEVLIYMNHIIGAIIILTPLFQTTFEYSTVMVGLGLLKKLTIMHMIRIIMYLSTTLPGPATHCQPGSVSWNPPTNWVEILFRFSTYADKNCGDLIPSGHMLQNISFTILTYKYAPLFYNINFAKFLTGIQIVNSILQPIFIVASRNHYTIDIVVAIYIACSLHVRVLFSSRL